MRHPLAAVLVFAALVGLAGAELTVLAPGWFGLAGYLPWAQLVTLRGLVGAASAVAGVLTLGGWGLSRAIARARAGSRAPGRSAPGARSSGRALLVGFALVQLAVLVTEFAVIAARGYATDALPTTASGPDELTVMVANTYQGRASTEPLAALAVRVGADVLSLPESGTAAGARVRAALRARGVSVEQFVAPRAGVVSPTTLLVSERLGPYAQVQAPEGGPGAITVAPTGHDGPLLAAAHPFPPLGRARTATWRELSRRAVEVCRSGPNVVLAGDFNATIDHPALQELGPCVDAASQRGAAAHGTWPARLPAVLGGPLDHVLVTASRWQVVSYSVAPIPGSDHRAVIVRLRRR